MGRILNAFLTAAAGLYGQFEMAGVFGPVTEHLGTGDFAPDLRFDTTLHSATGIPWNQGNLSGHPSALAFLPDIHDNPELITEWNALAAKFGEKVQLIWITAEEESVIKPWLAQHPMSGWVFNDPKNQTAQAYGLEQPTTVFIGADHKILGFEGGILPREEVLAAVLEGRITTTPPKRPATMAEALAQAKAMSQSREVYLATEAPRMPRPENHKPDFPPSRELHISASKDELGGGNYSADDYWSLQGLTLKSFLSEITGLSASRIDLPASLDTRTRYDFSLVLASPAEREYMRALMQEEVERQFHLVSVHENRHREVYVLRAGEKKPPAAANDSYMRGFASSMGFFSSALADGADPRDARPPGINDMGDIGTMGTVDEFCAMLEHELDRPIVNETGLKGSFEFRVTEPRLEEGKLPPHDFVQRLRDQLGLIVTEEQRNVDTLVFTPTTQ
jgi:uncharacterized protein (TIGR03435 family)